MSQQEDFLAVTAVTGTLAFLDDNYISPCCFDGVTFQSVAHGLVTSRYAISEAIKTSLVESNETVAELEKRLEDAGLPRIERNEALVYEALLRDKFVRAPDLRKQLKETTGRSINLENAEGLSEWLTLIRTDVETGRDFAKWLVVCVEAEPSSAYWPDVHFREIDGLAVKLPNNHEESFWSIGALESCVLRLDNPTVSREHGAVVVLRGGGVAIVDRKSTGGTMVNGIRLDAFVPYVLTDTDTLSFGSSLREYRVEVNKARLIRLLEEKERGIEIELQKNKPKAAIDSQPGDSNTNRIRRIFIGNLSFSATRGDLRTLGAPFGAILDISLPQNDRRQAQASEDMKAARGFAFIEFEEPTAAADAVRRLDGELFMDRKLMVRFEEPRRPTERRLDDRRQSRYSPPRHSPRPSRMSPRYTPPSHRDEFRPRRSPSWRPRQEYWRQDPRSVRRSPSPRLRDPRHSYERTSRERSRRC